MPSLNFPLLNLIGIACVFHAAVAFAPPQTLQTHISSKNKSEFMGRQSLSMSSFFDDVGKFFDGLTNKYDLRPTQNAPVSGNDVDGAYTGSKRIITIPGAFQPRLRCYFHF
jgi:hypothetical protein